MALRHAGRIRCLTFNGRTNDDSAAKIRIDGRDQSNRDWRDFTLPPENSPQPEGLDGGVFDEIRKAVAEDRYAFFTEFFKNFYNTDVFLGKHVSEQAIQAS